MDVNKNVERINNSKFNIFVESKKFQTFNK